MNEKCNNFSYSGIALFSHHSNIFITINVLRKRYFKDDLRTKCLFGKASHGIKYDNLIEKRAYLVLLLEFADLSVMNILEIEDVLCEVTALHLRVTALYVFVQHVVDENVLLLKKISIKFVNK